MASKKEAKAKKTAERKKSSNSAKPTRRPKQKGKIKNKDQRKPEFQFHMRSGYAADVKEEMDAVAMVRRGVDNKVAIQVARARRERNFN